MASQTPVDALGERRASVAGPEQARDTRGGPVGEEDAQPDEGLEDGCGDAEAGQLGGAEVAHDRRVGEQEHRLGDEREERGQRQSPDLAIQRSGEGVGHGQAA